jgi:citrate lyase subunit beta / citryl-CoA lyase
MLFVPGDNAAALSNAFIYKPDSVMFDLEDAVSTREKDSARLLVFQALRHPAYKEIETVVRVNALKTEFGLKDLEAAVRGGTDIVRLPKTESAEAIHELEAHVLRIEKACGRHQGDGGDRIRVRRGERRADRDRFCADGRDRHRRLRLPGRYAHET